MKTIKIIFALSMLLCATKMTAQKTDAVLIDSIQNSLSPNACRTIVVDNQPERPTKTHLRVRGVDESPIVIYLNPEAAPKSGKKYKYTKKRHTAVRHTKSKKEKPSAPQPEEEKKEPAVQETAQTDTTTYAASADLAQKETDEDDNSKYYYGVGGLLIGALASSPLYFRNRKKKGV